VADILRGPAELIGLVIDCRSTVTGESEPSDMPASRALSPDFSAGRYEYSIVVPEATEQLRVRASLGKAARVGNYTKTPGPGQPAADPDAFDGPYPLFNFPPGEPKCELRVRVERDSMETAVYAIRVYRQQPSWITSITAHAIVPVTDPEGSAVYYPSPSFDSSIDTFTLGVPKLTAKFRIHLTKRNKSYEDKTNIQVEVTGNGRITSGANAAEVIYEQDFPASENTAYIRVAVRNPTENDSAVVYHLNIGRPFRIYPVPGQDDWVAISGARIDDVEPAGYYFQPAEAVTFTASPRFGQYATSLVARGASSGKVLDIYSQNPIPSEADPLRRAADYTVIMPTEDVEIALGGWQPVETPSGGLNVRYIDDQGTGDGSSWANASKDLQAAINGYNADGVTGTADDYQIWVAGGTYNVPEWSQSRYWDSALGRPPWAEEYGEKTEEDYVSTTTAGWEETTIGGSPLEGVKTNRVFWAFVLKSGVHIYGGFDGSEKSAEERNVAANPTVLQAKSIDGDFALPTMRAVVISGADNILLDGLTIAGPHLMNQSESADGYRVNGNFISLEHGGALYLANASPVLKNVTIQNGKNKSAPNLFVSAGSRPVLIDCVISGGQGNYGGSAVCVADSGSGLVMAGGAVKDNFAAGEAALMLGGTCVFVNVDISGNVTSAAVCGDFDHNIEEIAMANPPSLKGEYGVFINCSFTGNRQKAPYDETHAHHLFNSVTLYNCVIDGNIDPSGGSAPSVNGVAGANNSYQAGITGVSGTTGTASAANFPLDGSGGWRDCAAKTKIFELFSDSAFRDATIKPALLSAAVKLNMTGNAIAQGAVQ
jgi:hypothetical protein